ncbi:hypothetical protein KFK09_001920 [Dendrobium nobile]|uniref:Uncharacterized protein n=1 Tax=Dendrobium nobile TaxID=94219 RepID=A0A8T3CBL5_DENNO|nr:hypothetical protein KFK09_001920 [Dendrobium nobile]
MAVRDQDTVKWPHPLKLNTENQDQYCHFHRSHGHTTEACRQLKEEIERLIHQGYLRQPPVNNQIAVGEIKIIAGGPLLSDKVFLAVNEIPTPKKARVYHSITIDDSDLEGVKTLHQDPLVINTGIGDLCYNVKRILVDNGSFTDVLFYSTFLNSGLTREKLQPVVGPLYGFDNRPVRAEGIISLPVVLGEFPRQSTHSIQFIVQVIEQEVDKLLDAGFIREVNYHNWLANIVMVRKGSEAWRMCIDYTYLNKDYPKDSFSLPRIDQLVDTTSGHQMLSFMDAYSRYNQIKMNPTDEEATSFQTGRGLHCYRVMPFGLKNTGATYQCLMNKVFKTLIGCNMEVYVDDMFVKSLEKYQHISDLEQYFHLLRRYNIRLNPDKCAFGVASGKFLGFIVTHRGIEANPEKIKALRDMMPSKNIKKVQRLNRRMFPGTLRRQITLEYGLRLKFSTTNNTAEYEAVIVGLRLAIDCEVQNLIVHTDSQLVASQVEGEFDIHNPQLAQYCNIVKLLLTRIKEHQIIHVLREQNARADALSKLSTSMMGDVYKRKCIEEIHFPSIQGPWVIQSIDEPREVSWIDLILSFLQDGILPEEPMVVTKLRRQASNFTIIGGEFYKRAFTGPYLKCLSPSKADYALREVHSGVCGENLGGRALAYKIMR